MTMPIQSSLFVRIHRHCSCDWPNYEEMRIRTEYYCPTAICSICPGFPSSPPAPVFEPVVKPAFVEWALLPLGVPKKNRPMISWQLYFISSSRSSRRARVYVTLTSVELSSSGRYRSNFFLRSSTWRIQSTHQSIVWHVAIVGHC